MLKCSPLSHSLMLKCLYCPILSWWSLLHCPILRC
jgi:hypothetical protein